MNCPVFSCRELEVEHYQIREVLRCILHTIMFNRALGVIRPKDVDSELFEITYAQCGDEAIERKIEEKIDNFVAWVEKHPNKKGQVCLTFYETRNKQMAWFGSKVERLHWEQWYISLNVVPKAPPLTKLGYYPDKESEERKLRNAALEASLREVIVDILRWVNEKKDHIPPVVSNEVATFPFEISIPGTSESSFGMDIVKRIMQTAPPNMLG